MHVGSQTGASRCNFFDHYNRFEHNDKLSNMFLELEISVKIANKVAFAHIRRLLKEQFIYKEGLRKFLVLHS